MAGSGDVAAGGVVAEDEIAELAAAVTASALLVGSQS